MGEKYFKNKYRVATTRLNNHDYSCGTYFITICAKPRSPFFGKNIGKRVVLSHLGMVARQCWSEIPKHFPDVVLDEFIVMPDHFHGILSIFPKTKSQNFVQHYNVLRNALCCNVETQNFASLRDNALYHEKCGNAQRNFASIHDMYYITAKPNKFGPQSCNLASVVRGFKICVSKYARLNKIDFMWQPRFYETIIRNEKHLKAVRKYIFENPFR